MIILTEKGDIMALEATVLDGGINEVICADIA